MRKEKFFAVGFISLAIYFIFREEKSSAIGSNPKVRKLSKVSSGRREQLKKQKEEYEAKKEIEAGRVDKYYTDSMARSNPSNKPKYFAYRNIHKGKGPNNHYYSLKNKKTNRVEKSGRSFVLKDAEFKVSENGRKRVLKEKAKNVHAGVEGVLYTGSKTKGIKWERVSYDPYKVKKFKDTKGNVVEYADFVKLTKDGVFIGEQK
jgi:hypothetical protein